MQNRPSDLQSENITTSQTPDIIEGQQTTPAINNTFAFSFASIVWAIFLNLISNYILPLLRDISDDIHHDAHLNFNSPLTVDEEDKNANQSDMDEEDLPPLQNEDDETEHDAQSEEAPSPAPKITTVNLGAALESYLEYRDSNSRSGSITEHPSPTSATLDSQSVLMDEAANVIDVNNSPNTAIILHDQEPLMLLQNGGVGDSLTPLYAANNITNEEITGIEQLVLSAAIHHDISI